MTRSLQIDLLDRQVGRFSVADLQAALHFSSGVNAPGEVNGLANNAFNIGITCGEIRAGLLETLETYGGWANARLFVDSGAFSEVAWSAELLRFVVVHPITEDAWRQRFAIYLWAARCYGRRALVVAPDLVGDQDATLARMARWAAEVREIAAAGASVVIPVQKGALPMSEMFRRCLEILELPAEQTVAGVPSKKDATSLEDLGELARSLPPGARVHLLGLGPESRRFAGAVSTVRRHCAAARITSDSVTLRRLVGRTNGPGGGLRVLTRCQDEARAEWQAPQSSQAIKDIAIRRWRQGLYSLEDAFQMRAAAGAMGLG